MSLEQQALADRQEEQAIAVYERWQGWAQEHALAEIETRLRTEEGSEGSWTAAIILLALSFVLLGLIWFWR